MKSTVGEGELLACPSGQATAIASRIIDYLSDDDRLQSVAGDVIALAQLIDAGTRASQPVDRELRRVVNLHVADLKHMVDVIDASQYAAGLSNTAREIEVAVSELESALGAAAQPVESQPADGHLRFVVELHVADLKRMITVISESEHAAAFALTAREIQVAVDELESALAQPAATQPAWQPIESAGEIYGRHILVYVPHNQCVFTVFRFPGMWWQVAGAGIDAFLPDTYQPTHWMPLPAPPTQPVSVEQEEG